MNPLTKRLLALGASSVIAVTGGYLIQPWEGKANHAYKDLVGVPTLCFGETKSVRMGDYKTDEECEKSLASELAAYNKNMKRNVTVPLKEYEEIAYTSFVWNIGETKWNSSTLLKKLNAGDNLGACKELLRWNMAGGKPVKGLTNRRIAEYNVCTNQDSKVSDALEALHTAQEAPLNVDEEEHQPITVEAVVAPVETVVQATPPVCKVVFFGVCFWKGK